jgi:hypothetical protein
MDADAHGPGAMETRRAAAVFRQHPGWVVFHTGLAALTVITMPLCRRDPEYRAAFFFAVNPLTSLKFAVVTTLVVLGWITYIPLMVRMWRSAWIFEITPDQLIATHQFGQRRHAVPWGSVAGVRKLPPHRSCAACGGNSAVSCSRPGPIWCSTRSCSNTRSSSTGFGGR